MSEVRAVALTPNTKTGTGSFGPSGPNDQTVLLQQQFLMLQIMQHIQQQMQKLQGMQKEMQQQMLHLRVQMQHLLSTDVSGGTTPEEGGGGTHTPNHSLASDEKFSDNSSENRSTATPEDGGAKATSEDGGATATPEDGGAKATLRSSWYSDDEAEEDGDVSHNGAKAPHKGDGDDATANTPAYLAAAQLGAAVANHDSESFCEPELSDYEKQVKSSYGVAKPRNFYLSKQVLKELLQTAAKTWSMKRRIKPARGGRRVSTEFADLIESDIRGYLGNPEYGVKKDFVRLGLVSFLKKWVLDNQGKGPKALVHCLRVQLSLRWD